MHRGCMSSHLWCFPCGLKFHLDPCRSISSNKKDTGSRRTWGMGKRCEHSMEGGVFMVGGWKPRHVWALVGLVLEKDGRDIIE
jgi:hypothetical protein